MKTNTKIIFTEKFTFIWIIITHKTWITFQFSNRYSSINQINVVRNQLTGKCILNLYLNGRPCPWTSIQHHHRIRIPWDHTCVRGSFCRTESFHARCSLWSPKPYCTYLCKYLTLVNKFSEFEFSNYIRNTYCTWSKSYGICSHQPHALLRRTRTCRTLDT